MVAWRLQDKKFPLVNSEGSRITGGRWNQAGTPVIYASASFELAALEIFSHHGGIPENHIGIRTEIPDDLEIGTIDVPGGWADIVPEEITARQGTEWVEAGRQAVLRVQSATSSRSGFNYILNPAHPDFARLHFSFEDVRFDPRILVGH